LLPFRIGVVAADDAIALRLGPRAVLVEARHLEGDVVNARPALGEEAVDESRWPHRLDELDAAAPVESIGAPGERPRGISGIGNAAQHAGEKGRGIGHSRHPEGDVVEEDAIDPAHPAKILRAASRARSMPGALTSR